MSYDYSYNEYESDDSGHSARQNTGRGGGKLWLIVLAFVLVSAALLVLTSNGGREILGARVVIQLVNFDSKPAKLGGVYYDLLAQNMAGIGDLIGAVYDSASDRVVLLCEKNSAMPALRPEDFAVAMRTVFAREVEAPAASIDPDPENPRADSMRIKFFGGVESTHFGWVMLEADRKMKGYSLGRDNVTRAAVISQVPDYYNLIRLSFSNLRGKYNPGIWSRFWLYARPLTPEGHNVVVRVSPNWRSIHFEPVKMGVRTETMKWQSGRLVPAGNLKDEMTEYFANHFTYYYDVFAQEDQIYAQLRRQMQLLAVAQWIKYAGIPFDPYFLERFGKVQHDIPRKTPSLIVDSTGATETVQIFGGTDSYVHTFYAQDDGSAARLENAIAAKLPHDKMRSSFDVDFEGKESLAVVFPGPSTLTDGGLNETHIDLTVGSGQGLGLTVNRYSSSLHNESFEFGRGATLNIPRLFFYNPAPKIRRKRKDGQEETGQETKVMSVSGRAHSQVQVQKFYLYDALGYQHAAFGAPQIDQVRGEIFFPSENNETIVGLYSHSDGAFEILFRDGKKMFFNEDSPYLQKEIINGEVITYEYDNHGLAGVRKANQWIEFQYQGGVITSARTSDGQTRQYEYEADGKLKGESGASVQRQFEIVDASGQTVRARLNTEANILSIDRHYQPNDATQKLWENFFSKENESVNALLATAGENASVQKVFDLGPEGYIVFAENRFHFRAASINELRASLRLAFENPAISSDELQVLNAIFGKNAQHLGSKDIILNSQDKELDLWAASYLRKNGKMAYVDDRVDIAMDNLRSQKATDKSRPGLIADEDSFRKHPHQSKLKEYVERIKDAFRRRGHEISTTFAQIPPQSNLLIITAENDGELSRKLQEIGPRLQGKHVIVFSCGDINNITSMPEAAHHIIANHKSRGVMSFYKKIDIEAVEAVIKELVTAAQESPFEDIETLMNRAIERAAETNSNNEVIRRSIWALRKRWHQISLRINELDPSNILAG